MLFDTHKICRILVTNPVTYSILKAKRKKGHGLNAVRKKLLIIEDNKKVLEILAFALGREGYEIIQANDGLSGLQLAEECSPDLIVLDLAPPVTDGAPAVGNLEVCRGLREGGRVPVLVFTLMDEEKNDLLNAGADDYIHKPFAMKELLAKVRVNTWHLDVPAVGRAGIAKRLVLGRIIIDPEQAVALKDGNILALTQREFDLLAFLAKEPGRVFSREELMRQVWDYGDYLGGLRAVDVSIRRLREKIEDDPSEPAIIVTRRGRGYLFAPDQQ